MQCETDQTTHVQLSPDPKVKGLVQEATGRACLDSSFDSGVCGDGECLDCTPVGQVLIPTDQTGFPPGSLTCIARACRFASGSTNSDFYEFKNSSNYLICGDLACGGNGDFRAKNLAALCCSGSSSCRTASFQLHGDHSIGGDVCCSGSSACTDTTVTNVRHMACIGFSCFRVDATLVGDLTIRSTSTVGPDSSFTFTEGASHCIRVLGASTSNRLVRAEFTFQKPSNISMRCNAGTKDCQQVDVNLPKGSCFHVDCGSSGTSCQSFEVDPLVPGETDFKCFCSGSGSNCAWANSPDHPYCETTTDANPCGTDSCPGSLPVCAANDETVDCARLATTTTTTLAGGAVAGDPHLRTLDGRHYTLIQQGNFLLWGFSGDTDIMANKSAEKMPVNFEIFAHYAGHASFTKGLLFVDKSTMPNQALEVTTKDCLWHHWGTGDASWRPVQSALLHLGDSDGTYGAFNLSVSVSNGQRKLEMLINHDGNIRKLAQLWVSCRPGQQLSAKIRMPSQKDLQSVRGELAPGRLSLATGGEGHHKVSQMTTDPEFAVKSDWGDLGGSPSAASYFKLVDAAGPQDFLFTSCAEAEKEQYAKTCKKHLGDSAGYLYEQVVDDCIFDLCHGAGEISAELAAEIYHA